MHASSAALGEAPADAAPTAAPTAASAAPALPQDVGRDGTRRLRRPGFGVVLSSGLATLSAALAAVAVAAGLWQPPHPDAGRRIADWGVMRLDWWLHPLERHAPKRLVIRGHLDGLHVQADGQRLWVVGSRGLILHSCDGGVRWTQQHPPEGAETGPGRATPPAPRLGLPIGSARAAEQKAYDPSSATRQTAVPGDSPPATKADVPRPVQQAAPVDAGPLPSSNVGATKSKAKSPRPDPGTAEGRPTAADKSPPPPPPAAVPRGDPLTADLHDVVMTRDGQRGWAVGDDGVLLATADGGQTWRSQPAPEAAAWRRVGYGGDAVWIGDERQVRWTSRDGGRTWQPPVAPQVLVPGRYRLPDGARTWQVDEQGRIRSSVNGTNWADSGVRAGAPLRAVQFEPTGQRGWAVGDHGTLLASRDGGRSWGRQSAGVTAFEPGDYERYPAPWTWPVALAAVALAAAVALRGFRPALPKGTTETAAHVLPALGHDQPLTDLKDDRLGYRGSVLALSDFLRNGSTEPKLTLAITAPWGMGKTSIMGMLRSELHRAGFRTAWFNAWHHQQEGRPLTALFNTIRSQAVPSIWREPVAAVRVRSRLLWARGWAYRLGLLLVGVPLAVLVAVDLDKGRRDSGLNLPDLVAWNFVHHWLQQPHVAITPASLAQLTPSAASPGGPGCENAADAMAMRAGMKLRPAVYCYVRQALVMQGDGVHHACNDQRGASAHRCVFDSPQALLDTIDRSLFAPGSGQRLLPSERTALLAAAERIDPPPLLPTVMHLVPMLALLGVLLTKGFSIYGLEVFKPLTRLFAKARPDGGHEPTGTIERYRREFCLLTQALDGRLVVFVDDLDRCDRATINSMLEMSNYLIDHGRCFIVLAASMDQVKAAVTVPEGHDPERYRNEYLRKLVHIELPVPMPGDAGLAALLDRDGAPPVASNPRRLRWQIAGGWVRAHAGWATALAAGVTLAAAIADLVGRPGEIEPVQAVAPSAPPTALAAGTQQAFTLSLPVLQRTAIDGAVGVRQPAPDLAWLAWLGGLATLALASALGARQGRTAMEALTVALGGALRTEDSQPFRRALALWRDAVRTTDATPRGLKRFCNRARLFAIVERLDALDPVTPEHHVVALTAMHHVSPELVARLGEALQRSDGAELAWQRRDWSALRPMLGGDAGPVDASTWRLLTRCLDAHARAFHELPDGEAVHRFNALLGRIAVR